MKDTPLAALDLEVLSLPKEHAVTDQRQNHAHSHQPAWLGQPPAKVPSTLTWTLTWGRIASSPHSFSSGLLCKGRQATGQLLVVFFCDVTAAQWEMNGGSRRSPEHFSLHFRAISQSSGGGNISLVITWDGWMEQAWRSEDGQTSSDPELHQLWYNTSVTINVLTNRCVPASPKGLQGDLGDAYWKDYCFTLVRKGRKY